MSWILLLADTISVLHALFSIFVLLGLLTIMIGRWRKWRWTDNKTFRLAHFAAIAAVSLRVIMGMPCPCSQWEDNLRGSVGESIERLDSSRMFLRRLACRGARENRFQWGLFTLAGFTLVMHKDWRSRQISR